MQDLQASGPSRFDGPSVIATATALPDHYYSQEELAVAACDLLPTIGSETKLVQRFFQRVHVRGRHLALPIQEYKRVRGLRARNDAWLSTALALGERALRDLFERAEVDAREINLILTTTVTGLSVPSLDARLMNRLPFSSALKRVPLFGLGCLAGTAGVARASEYLRAYPRELAVLLAVELCSLTMQSEDASVANIVSSGLFGDGAAAVLLGGQDHALARGQAPRVLDSLARFFPSTDRVMGWDVVDTGFKVVLSPEVPRLARSEVPVMVDELLARHGLTRDQIQTWIAHPGGPAVADAICEGLGLPEEKLALTRRSLEEIGNLSSASVLFVLDEVRRKRLPQPGSYGVMLSMGPAFCAEAVLLAW